MCLQTEHTQPSSLCTYVRKYVHASMCIHTGDSTYVHTTLLFHATPLTPSLLTPTPLTLPPHTHFSPSLLTHPSHPQPSPSLLTLTPLTLPPHTHLPHPPSSHTHFSPSLLTHTVHPSLLTCTPRPEGTGDLLAS